MKYEEVEYVGNQVYTVAVVIWSWKGTVTEYFGMSRKEAKAIVTEFNGKDACNDIKARFGGDLAYTL